MSEQLEDDFNSTNQVMPKFVVDGVWQENLNRTAYTIIMPIICAFGIFGNCLNLIVLTRKNLKAATYIYLRAMAVADLMSLVFTIPMIIRYAHCELTTFAAAWYHAHLELPLANAFIGSSVLVTVAITVERFIAVCIPMQAKKYQTPSVAKYVIITGFVVAFALYSPMCLYKYVTPLNENSTQYTFEFDKNVVLTKWFSVYEWFREAILRLGPTVVLALMNIKIVVVFYKKVKKRSKMQSRKDQKKFREDQRLIILLISIVILFFVCTLPASILILFYNIFDHGTHAFHIFRAVANLVEITNYALNFYIYCLCSPEFRNTFFNTFCICHKKTSRSERESLEFLTTSTQVTEISPSANTEMNNTPSEKRNRSLLVWMTARQVAIIHDRISYPFAKTKGNTSKNLKPALENHVTRNTKKDIKSNDNGIPKTTDSPTISVGNCKHNSVTKNIPETDIPNADCDVNIYISNKEKFDSKEPTKKKLILVSDKDIHIECPINLNEDGLRRSNSEKFEKRRKPDSLKRSTDSLRNENIFINGIPKVRSKPEKLSNYSIDSKNCFRSTSSSSSSPSGTGSIGSRRKIRFDGISTSV